MDQAKPGTSRGLVKGLSLFDATMIIMGSMIGSGIFIVSADISRQVQSPALLIVVWVVTGVITLSGALCYSELAAALPKAGGQYVFLREGLGPLWGFLYGWTMLLVIQTATIAAVAIAFAKFAGVVVPWISSSNWILQLGTFGPFEFGIAALGPYRVGLNTQNLLAILSIVVLTLVNTQGLKAGTLIQNIFTTIKTGALLVLIFLCFFFTTDMATRINFAEFFSGLRLFSEHAYSVGTDTVWIGTITLVGVAMVGSLFASVAWENVTFTAAEVNNPQRNLPLAMTMGVGIVTVLYVTANFAYLNVLPLMGDPEASTALQRGMAFAAEDRVGSAAAEVIFGPSGAIIMAIAIMISTFGCNNGLILAGARIFYAMAKDGLFFKKAADINRHHVPGFALGMQCAWASLLCLSGTYSQLLDFIIFSVLLFYMLTIIGLLVLRKTKPDMQRPYRVILFPWLPVLYLLLAAFVEIQLLRYKPQYTWPGLIIVLLGIPVYYLWKRRKTSS